jgi:hypothetical protein
MTTDMPYLSQYQNGKNDPSKNDSMFSSVEEQHTKYRQQYQKSVTYE